MCFEKQCLSAVLKIELGIYSIDFDNRAKFAKNILERYPGPAFGGAPRALPRPAFGCTRFEPLRLPSSALLIAQSAEA